MKVTVSKSEIKKAKEFLKTVPVKNWCKGAQTYNDDKKNIGKLHCAIGHLSVNPSSPFYDRDFVNEDKTNTKSGAFGETLNYFCFNEKGVYLSAINNYRSTAGGIHEYNQATPKARVIAFLDDLLKSLNQ